MSIRPIAVALLVATLMPAAVHAQVTIRSNAGATAAAITLTRDQFRIDLGGGTTAGANGSFGALRREINWDGTPATLSAPNLLPSNFFNATSPRGVEFTTPGTSFMVSGATTDVGAGQPAPVNFGNLDPSYSATFAPFTAQRLFTMRGSNIIDVRFFLPGTQTPAAVSGFGVVFSDVDLAATTTIQLFDAGNTSLGSFFAPPGAFSFLGVFNTGLASTIARVRITCGNVALNPGVIDSPTTDVVVMDDFIYGEPVVIGGASGACCHGATCAIVANSAACTAGGTYLGDARPCTAQARTGTVNLCCPTDYNNVGGLSIQDIFDFINAWFSGC